MEHNTISTEVLKSQEKGGVFQNISNFEAAQRMVKPLTTSQLIPLAYKGRVDDCLIALEMAQRIGASPLAVLQNLYIVHGKPAWSSQFLIATINASGKFSPLRYKMVGTAGKDSYGCFAWAVDAAGEKLEGPTVTIKMANDEGWMTKNGSKWKTMPELMLRYRAATLFARLYAPELMMGIKTDDEIIDIDPVVTEQRKSRFDVAEIVQCDTGSELSPLTSTTPPVWKAEMENKELPLTNE